MKTVSATARFDGKHIKLDELLRLEPLSWRLPCLCSHFSAANLSENYRNRAKM